MYNFKMASFCSLLIALFTLVGPCVLQGQKYQTGKIGYGLLSAKPVKGTVVDSMLLKLVQTELAEEVDREFFFKPGFLAFASRNEFGDSARVVVDVEKKQLVRFTYNRIDTSFVTDSIDQAMIAGLVDQTNGSEIDTISYEPYEQKLFGLNCYRLKGTVEGQPTEIITTKDIALSTVSENSSMQGVGTVLKYKITLPINIVIELGVQHFDWNIDESIFSLDTSGMENKTALAEAFGQAMLTNSEMSETHESRRAAIVDHSLILSWADKGLIETTDPDTSYDGSINNWPTIYGYALDENTNIDLAHMLSIAIEESSEITKLSKEELSTVLLESDMLTPSVRRVLVEDNGAIWNSLPVEARFEAVALACAKDQIDKVATRSQIADNLVKRQHCSTDAEFLSQYREGRMSLVDLISSLEHFSLLMTKKIVSDSEILKLATTFFQNVFALDNVQIRVERNKELLLISDEKNTHQLFLSDFREEDELSNYSVDPPKLSFKDTVVVDYFFYDKLTRVAKQISVDQKLNKYIGLALHSSPLPRFNEFGDYSEYRDTILKVAPFVYSPNEYVFLKSYPIEDLQYRWERFGVSFPYLPNIVHREMHVPALSNGDLYAEDVYLSTSAKQKFINYLAKYRKEFGLKKVDVRARERQILDRLYKNAEELLRTIPNLKITLDRFEELVADEAFKRDYKSPFSDTRRDFKDGYYTIASVVGDDFQPTDFRYDSEEHMMYFQYDEKEYKVRPGKKAMVAFIIGNVTSASGKRLYEGIYDYTNSQISYYYLTPKAKEELTDVLGIEF